MLRRNILFISCLAVSLTAVAQNPIIKGQYTADPTARAFGDKLYLYPSHDIVNPMNPNKKWFAMADYHVYSSKNLSDWTDHGVILDQQQVEWGNPKGYSMWAPDCVEHKGKYYLFFPDASKLERGFGIGIAIAPSPIGPFVPEKKPLEGVMGIDPCVLQTSKGEDYLVWAGMGIRMAKLSDDLLSLASRPIEVKGLPEGFKEGPFAFERDGWYYLTFPWVRHKNSTETLAYAMSRNPEGPYTFKGVFMDEWANGCWTNHHSFVKYDGQWYLFYHHNDYSPNFDKNRSVCIDPVFFNADGTIRKVIPSLRGVGITDARKHIQIDRYSSLSKKHASINYLDLQNPFKGWYLKLNAGGWASYDRVNFKSGLTQLSLRVKSATPVELNVFVGNKMIAHLTIPAQKEFTVHTFGVKSVPIGIIGLRVQLVKGESVDIDWLSFEEDNLHPWTEGAFQTHKYRNYFAELGYSEAEVKDRLNKIFQEVFFGPDKVYFEVGDSLGYVSDLKNHDVRTEGMSYGMMAAVQMGRKDIFDRIYRWARKYMLYKDGPLKGYFTWSCKPDGTRNAEGPASDGELYFITSLIFASNRWGNNTGINYLAEAQYILNNSFSKHTDGQGVTPLIDKVHHIITFVPTGFGARISDPSYNIPSFYEVWARWANDGRADFYRQCEKATRNYLHKSINPVTGLNPDTNNLDGSILSFNGPHGHFEMSDFSYDSWRVPMNIALDYSWSCADPVWQQQYANTIQDFFFDKGIDAFIDQYHIDGMPAAMPNKGGGKPGLRHSVGLVGTLGAVSLAATYAKARDFINRLWNSSNRPFPDGYFDAYYDGFLRLFAFMHLSGEYRIIFPKG
jgi:endo-1,4-beta-D-glucanase Y